MFALVSLPPLSPAQTSAHDVVQKIFDLSEAGRTTERVEREALAREEVDVFLSTDAACPPRPLGRAAKLLTDALCVRTPPKHGSLLLTQAIDHCLLPRTESFRTIHEAVQSHWGAWGAIAGVVTICGGQPLLEQCLLAVRLSETLDRGETMGFAEWFAHPTHLGVLRNLTSPVEEFLASLHNAASFLADPEIREELFAEEIQEDTVAPITCGVSLEQGELWARALGLHQHLSLPDLSYAELNWVESFYQASGFSSVLEDIVRQTWAPDAPCDAVALGINMLGYAMAFWVWEALQAQPSGDVEAFAERMSDAPIAAWSRLVGSISQEVESRRRASIAP